MLGWKHFYCNFLWKCLQRTNQSFQTKLYQTFQVLKRLFVFVVRCLPSLLLLNPQAALLHRSCSFYTSHTTQSNSCLGKPLIMFGNNKPAFISCSFPNKKSSKTFHIKQFHAVQGMYSWKQIYVSQHQTLLSEWYVEISLKDWIWGECLMTKMKWNKTFLM